MRHITVGIQGVKAAFHDMAARKYFDAREIELAEFRDFRALSASLSKKEIDYGVMAIENTIAGSLLPNYTLLEEYNLKIMGEVYLRIEMHLMCLAGQTTGDISKVISHPMALFQCTEYLSQYPDWKLEEVSDTAESAKNIVEGKWTGVAAIAGQLAAKTYGLEIIAPCIETNKKNYTRFLIIEGNKNGRTTAPNKASLRMSLEHRPGALGYALNTLNEFDLNMTKIQSIPIIGKPYEYSFNVDVEWKDYDNFRKGVEILEKATKSTKIIGEYMKGEMPKIL